MSRRVLPASVLAGLLLIPMGALSQEAQESQGQGRRRGGFDPAQMRERMLNNLKEQLWASDDQWDVLGPKIEKVMTAQRELRGAGEGLGGFGGPGMPQGGPPNGSANGGPPSADTPPGAPPTGAGGRQAESQTLSKIAQAQRDLRAVLESADSSEADIAKKLAVYRKLRERARADLEAAQKDMKSLLTERQEAVLVNAGLLE